MMKKLRADQLVFMQNLAESREKAQRYIMADLIEQILPDGNRIPVKKAGQQYAEDAIFSLKEKEKYVSRGAYKLLTLIDHFNIDIRDKICLDAGASTGGFTDCLIQHGAKKVYAIDVGHNQLHEKLLNNEKVINLEGINLRYAKQDLINEKIDILVSDVSFISLTLILPPCIKWLKNGGLICALIKPQFELGPNETVKGVVKDENKRQLAVNKITTFCEKELKLITKGIVPSTIKGPKGNQEYMALFEKK